MSIFTVDPEFFVSVSFLLCIVGLYVPIKRSISKYVTDEIGNIKREIDDSYNLKIEAQTKLEEIKKKNDLFRFKKAKILKKFSNENAWILKKRDEEFNKQILDLRTYALREVKWHSDQLSENLKSRLMIVAGIIVREYMVKHPDLTISDEEIIARHM